MKAWRFRAKTQRTAKTQRNAKVKGVKRNDYFVDYACRNNGDDARLVACEPGD